jgi:hypothetical protein
LEVIFVAYFLSKNPKFMQSDQYSYLPILMQLILAVGFVVGTIIISGKL